MTTILYQISTPAPSSYLRRELKKIFPDTEFPYFPNDDDLESVSAFNLSAEEIQTIKENIGDLLIHVHTISFKKQII